MRRFTRLAATDTTAAPSKSPLPSFSRCTTPSGCVVRLANNMSIKRRCAGLLSGA